MKCQILVSGKNKKNIINLSSAENAQRVVEVKAPSKICSRRLSKIFCYFFYFLEKAILDISCESSAWQTIHMKYQDLFSSENKKKNKIK